MAINTIEQYIFFNLSSKEAMALFSEWAIKMDTYSQWASTYIQLEKTHIEKEVFKPQGSEMQRVRWIQKYSLIIIASQKNLTKKELINYLKNMKFDAVDIGGKKT